VRTVDIVPALKGNSLLSGGKFAEAGYISICDGKEVNIYDDRTAKITGFEGMALSSSKPLASATPVQCHQSQPPYTHLRRAHWDGITKFTLYGALLRRCASAHRAL